MRSGCARIGRICFETEPRIRVNGRGARRMKKKIYIYTRGSSWKRRIWRRRRRIWCRRGPVGVKEEKRGRCSNTAGGAKINPFYSSPPRSWIYPTLDATPRGLICRPWSDKADLRSMVSDYFHGGRVPNEICCRFKSHVRPIVYPLFQSWLFLQPEFVYCLGYFSSNLFSSKIDARNLL